MWTVSTLERPALRRVLSRGSGVIVFPEATSSQGAEILPFKPSLFEVAIEAEIPVSYAAIQYVTPQESPPAHLAVCWWGDMGLLSHAACLLTLPSVEAKVRFGEEPLAAEDRKQLAAQAQANVEELFDPVTSANSR